MNRLEAVFDFLIGAGTLDVADQLGDMTPYFLAEKDNIQLLVNITKDYIEAKELPAPLKHKIIVDKNRFIKTKIKI